MKDRLAQIVHTGGVFVAVLLLLTAWVLWSPWPVVAGLGLFVVAMLVGNNR